ncbi:MAG: alpha-N-arabinofuranosidase [Candidatus Abyssobacteria bacterium SURF_5]|uniref:non-reducing end alpha-L-arabinofuranosidase n=1 Tax=Abyssobacteria bacterium (strain SURF_5) TaxID=2093360 RepID=A0A3A4NZ75_ABYX5|nr:MAG: alpha-N-arabinofuranosidase [Candidatus Abyssubacteria bacterium SURF_5]
MAKIKIDVERKIGPINPNIYGGFIEHLGRCIYGGIYEEGSPLSDERGFRKDVLEIMKGLRLPNLRYPGGNFVSGYHWQDGVGPKDKRPRKLEFAWNTVEPNRFGTDEFIEYCRAINTEPFLCVNLGTGTPEEAAAWVEYCNGTDDSHYANMRRANGYNQPHNVKFWGLGNEMGGFWQIGEKNAQDYAKTAREAAKMMRWADPSIRLVGCGFLEQVEGPSWNLETIDKLAGFIDYLSLHIYTGNSDYYTNVAGPVRAQRLIDIFNATITIAMHGKKAARPEIAMDEWNVWYKAFGGCMEEQYDLSDALAVAGFLNVMHRNCTTVTLSNLSQMVNVIAPIFAGPEGLFLQTIYHSFKLYRDHCQPIALDPFVDSLAYQTVVLHEWSGGGHDSPVETVPYIDVSATVNEPATELSLAVVNRHRENPIVAQISLDSFYPKKVCRVFEINGPQVDAKNSFSEPDNVKTVEKRFNSAAAEFRYEFPAHSVTLLKLDSKGKS